jgi:hypothetical protein
MPSKPAANKTAVFDLESLRASEEPFEFELRHPLTNEPLGSFLSVYGQHSAVFRDLVRQMANQAIRKRFELQRRGKPEETPTIEANEEMSINLLVGAVAGWRNLQLDGADLEFSEDNARMLLTRFEFIRAQADAASGDLANFLKG